MMPFRSLFPGIRLPYDFFLNSIISTQHLETDTRTEFQANFITNELKLFDIFSFLKKKEKEEERDFGKIEIPGEDDLRKNFHSQLSNLFII